MFVDGKRKKLDRLIDRMRGKNVDKIGSCRLCNLTFGTYRSLAVHMREHCPNLIHLADESNGSTETNPSDSSRLQNRTVNDVQTKTIKGADYLHLQPYLCRECSATFSDTNSYHCHLDEHNQQDMRLLDSPSSSQSLEYLLQCKRCKIDFDDVGSYQLHLRVHATTQGICFVCGQVFDSMLELNGHMGSHKDSSHQCRFCGCCSESHNSVDSIGKTIDFSQHRQYSTPTTPLAPLRTASFHSTPTCPSRTTPKQTKLSNDYLNELLQDICIKTNKKKKRPSFPTIGKNRPLMNNNRHSKVQLKRRFSNKEGDLKNDYLNSVFISNVRKQHKGEDSDLRGKEQEEEDKLEELGKKKESETMMTLFQMVIRTVEQNSLGQSSSHADNEQQ